MTIIFGTLTKFKSGQSDVWLQHAIWIVGVKSHEDRQCIQTPQNTWVANEASTWSKLLGKTPFLSEVTLSSRALQSSECSPGDQTCPDNMIMVNSVWICDSVSSDTASSTLVKRAYALKFEPTWQEHPTSVQVGVYVRYRDL
jgi:hypothetical protein